MPDRIVILSEEEAVWLVGDPAARGLIRESIQAKLRAALQGDGGVTDEMVEPTNYQGFVGSCAYCGLDRLLAFNGRRWTCEGCTALQLNTPSEPETTNADGGES